MRMVPVLIQLFHQHGKTLSNEQFPHGHVDFVSWQLNWKFAMCRHVEKYMLDWKSAKLYEAKIELSCLFEIKNYFSILNTCLV